MRIDLMSGGRRPWFFRVALFVVRRAIGFTPGPPLVISYRPDLLRPALRSYLLRSNSHASAWSKGESELLAAFVSNLNACHF